MSGETDHEPHPGLARWKRFAVSAFVSGVGVAMVVLSLGVIYQAAAGYLDRKAAPPPGKMVDAGGFRMHLYCTGAGTPTVVLDSGLSDAWVHWYKVQPEISKVTRVCSYDRAGLGWSENSPRPRTSRVIAEELHTLLQNAGIAGPYVLAGHSMGGLDVRMFASLYPSEVAGMVLVDASHPRQWEKLPAEAKTGSAEWERTIRRDAMLMPLGIPRLLGWCGTSLPDRSVEFRSFDCTVKQKKGTIEEIRGFSESLAQVGATGSLGDRPLVVLSEYPADPEMRARLNLDVWTPLQEDMARLSSRGRHVVATGSGHQVHRERADLVNSALLDVVAQVRQPSNR